MATHRSPLENGRTLYDLGDVYAYAHAYAYAYAMHTHILIDACLGLLCAHVDHVPFIAVGLVALQMAKPSKPT